MWQVCLHSEPRPEGSSLSLRSTAARRVKDLRRAGFNPPFFVGRAWAFGSADLKHWEAAWSVSRYSSPASLGGSRPALRLTEMKAEYDLSKLKSRKNPYAAKLKKAVSMRLSEDVVEYFKGMAAEAGVPYQSLINLYLRDCVIKHRKVQVSWPSSKA